MATEQSKKEETVLVTGGAGFIASHIVDAYLEAGYPVIVVDDLSTGHLANLNPKATFHKISILDDGLAAIFADVKPAIVNHHAAQASVRHSIEDPAFDAKTNIIGSLKLLELARANGTKKFIFASTGGALYGEQDYFPADENHPIRPLAPYGSAKAAVEIYLHFYYAHYGLEYTALRYANVFGPRQDPLGEAGVVAIIIRQMLDGDQPVINGDGSQTRDFVYVGDIVAANMAATTSDFVGSINIGSGIETSVLALFGLMKEVSGAACGPKFGPAKTGEQMRSVLNAGLADAELGWKPRTSFIEGLAKTADFFKEPKQAEAR